MRHVPPGFCPLQNRYIRFRPTPVRVDNSGMQSTLPPTFALTDAPKSERRCEARQTVTRPAKIYVPSTGRFIPAQTCDVSTGGLLLETDSLGGALPAPGTPVCVSVLWTSRQALVAADDMIPARVVRSLSHEGRTRIALQLHQTQRLAVSA